MSPFRKDLINTSLYGCCTSYLNRRYGNEYLIFYNIDYDGLPSHLTKKMEKAKSYFAKMYAKDPNDPKLYYDNTPTIPLELLEWFRDNRTLGEYYADPHDDNCKYEFNKRSGSIKIYDKHNDKLIIIITKEEIDFLITYWKQRQIF